MRALVLDLPIALVMASIVTATYVTAVHAVFAHNLPPGQVGLSPLTTPGPRAVAGNRADAQPADAYFPQLGTRPRASLESILQR